MEIGCGQGEAVTRMISDQFPKFCGVTVVKDLSSLDRVVLLEKK
jgi:methylase of polypeptide subunit release factors